MPDDKKPRKDSVNWKFLIDSGLLFEINRSLLHPQGLALGVVMTDDGSEIFDVFLKKDDDPAGYVFNEEAFKEGKEKFTKYIESEGADRLNRRAELFGSRTQPWHDVVREIFNKRVDEHEKRTTAEGDTNA